MNRDENPQRKNEMDSPSFEGFNAQFDCKLTRGRETEKNCGEVGLLYS